MIGPSGLAPLALHQLAAWQRLAGEWSLCSAELAPGQLHLTCVMCDASVMALHDAHGGPYYFNWQIVLDATVMHLRARHADLEPVGL
jgi:hypothetical protein